MLEPHRYRKTLVEVGGGAAGAPADIITLPPSLSTVSKTRCLYLELWTSIEKLGVVLSDTASDLMLRLNQCLSFRSQSRASTALLLPQRKPCKGSPPIKLNFYPTVASETGNMDYCKIREVATSLKSWPNTWT